jgi:glutathione S-transferase
VLIRSTSRKRARILAVNPAGKLPLPSWCARRVGIAGVCEYAPAAPACRTAAPGLARSMAAEMHAGFMALRRAWPMNARALGRHVPRTPDLAAELTRIETLWHGCRRQHGSAGPWLFGTYSLADAMYAPVALRLRTYGATLAAAVYSHH